MAEDAWNSRDSENICPVCATGTIWRNRTEFFTGNKEVKAFLEAKVVKGIGLQNKK
jgi:nuclear transport factor 2 (NTF2) superfamily protein